MRGAIPSRSCIALFCLLWLQISSASAAPARIVSIAPSFTEILYALGLEQRIVGTTNYCDYPEPARHTAKIGDVLNPNLEKIISLHPDLVLCGAWKWQLPASLRKVGIRVVEIQDARNLQDVFNRVILIGQKTGRPGQAAAIVEQMKERMARIHSHVASGKPRKVYVELDTGNWTAGGGSYLNDVLSFAGLNNIFADRHEPYMMVTMESIASRQPDVILSLDRFKSDYENSPAWQALPAVQKGRIIDQRAIDWNAITRQSPRLVEGIQHLVEAVEKL